METPAGCLQETVRAAAQKNKKLSFGTADISIFTYLPATSSWFQVNLGQIKKVTGIVIQGCPQNDHWITKFKLQHSKTGATWTDYTADGDVSEPPRFVARQILGLNIINKLVFCSSLAQWTETPPTLSCWVHLCRLSSSASFRWSTTAKQAFA